MKLQPLVRLWRRAIGTAIVDPARVEQALGVRVHGALPRSREASAAWPAPVAGPQDGAADEAPFDPELARGLRSLHVALHLELAERGGSLVMLCGVAPHDGASMIAAGLAATAAADGQGVLLVDAAARPALHSRFGVSRAPGLAEVLAGGADGEAAVRRVCDGVDLLAAGGDEAGAEGVAGRVAAIGSAVATERYSLTVVDAGVAGTVPREPFAAGAMALLVVRSGRHTARELRAALHRLQSCGPAAMGAVLNGWPARRRGRSR